ncbi:hypothetical protein B0T25DRAFT_517144 [Lasiosphaeria hispida]|uniref:Uncharacterized protein n=1 Tax=Lasiosphaeria hispida TaxID=260671 RepID=A0AAJ0HN17_9PEZI|nr:hypothetical protein B0T25DRAFT_517144 [Lasiosphaeria hispida]
MCRASLGCIFLFFGFLFVCALGTKALRPLSGLFLRGATWDRHGAGRMDLAKDLDGLAAWGLMQRLRQVRDAFQQQQNASGQATKQATPTRQADSKPNVAKVDILHI